MVFLLLLFTATSSHSPTGVPLSAPPASFFLALVAPGGLAALEFSPHLFQERYREGQRSKEKKA